jgi:hypothetical protein
VVSPCFQQLIREERRFPISAEVSALNRAGQRLREMSNLELRRFGQRARKLSDPKMNFGATEPHVVELEEGEGGMAKAAQHLALE